MAKKEREQITTQVKKVKMTPVTAIHYVRFAYKVVLFIGVLIAVIYYKVNHLGSLLDAAEERWPIVLAIFWVAFMAEMISRFFPSKLESPGCQKHFAKNFIPTGEAEPIIADDHAAFIVAMIWILFNLGIGAFFLLGIFDQDIMLLISVAYSVCDIICILFYCPFQSIFFKNKCCSSCRIYNWNFAMMFTPLFFVPRVYTWSLLFTGIILMVQWEILLWRHPERFATNTNAYLSCANCNEKLCYHKSHLMKLWKRLEVYKTQRAEQMKTGIFNSLKK